VHKVFGVIARLAKFAIAETERLDHRGGFEAPAPTLGATILTVAPASVAAFLIFLMTTPSEP
jgi:hypothetical protein